MSITDKTRKILWGRSGNRCAICRARLVIDETDLDSESVIGEECHINSGALGGPRHDPKLRSEEIDGLSNLLLLCRTHHKMVDDQFETYTSDLLREIRSNHHAWVEEKFSATGVEPVRFRREKKNIPTTLPVVKTGPDLWGIVCGCHASYQSVPSDMTREESCLIGELLQFVQDLVDLGMDIDQSERLGYLVDLTEQIERLNKSGLLVFVASEKQRLEGGVLPPSNVFVAHITVARKSAPNVYGAEV